MILEVEPRTSVQSMLKNSSYRIELYNGLCLSQNDSLSLICGPCVIEGRDHALFMAESIQNICQKLGVGWIYKSSFDKANRSSVDSFRGVGLWNGLKILEEVRSTFDVPVLTDVHEPHQCDTVAEVVDILQIPAFLCRQTDLVTAAAETGKAVNVKKGQFLAPQDMKNIIEKIQTAHYSNYDQILLTERGTSFGYNNLVVDFRSLLIMREFGYPVCFDATHSQQLPGQLGDRSGGTPQYIPAFVRAAVAAGIDVLFMEVHDDPPRALSDGTNMLPLDQLEMVLRQALAIRGAYTP